MNSKHGSRRGFLKKLALTGAAGLTPVVLPPVAFGAAGRPSPSQRITLGLIGVGGEGARNLMAFLGQPDAQVVAICEVDPERRDAARDRVNQRYQNQDCATYRDFRGVLARGDIAMWLGRKLRWNPGQDRFTEDETANRMLSKATRAPWSV